MGYLKIKQVSYYGDKYYYESPIFSKKINIVLGNNGNGKSTLANLIYYGLGNKVPYFEIGKGTRKKPIEKIIYDTNNFVELSVIINGNEYIIKRGIGKNNIKITDVSNNEDFVFAINRNDTLYKTNNSIFSDWLLSKLNIGKLVMEQFGTTHYLNFDDLSRLIYYDQKSRKEDIFKEPEEDNYFKRSAIIKNGIFETLIGSTFQEYYDKFFELKNKEKEKEVLNIKIKNLENELNVIEEFDLESLPERLQNEKNEMSYLITELEEKRREIKENRFSSISKINNIDEIKKKILYLTNKERENISDKKIFEMNLEKSIRAKELVQMDISHLEKIIYTSINIINRNKNNCPFCNELIVIEKNKCLCGSENGLNFEKFMYSNEEYNSMLKSKSKTLLTVNDSIDFCISRITELTQSISDIQNNIEENKVLLEKLIDETTQNFDTEYLDNTENSLFNAKAKFQSLSILIEKTKKLFEEKENLNNLKKDIDILNKRLIELASEKDQILSKNYKKFNKIYDEYITEYYTSIKKEKPNLYLNNSYMPELNFYQEDSAYEPIKFFYYMSLLKLSLIENSVSFPRILIIDGFDSGLDKNKITACYKLMIELINDYPSVDFQIFLTNRHDTFKKVLFKDFIIEEFFDENLLLKAR